MPSGVYEKTRLYRKTSKLTQALNALKSQDPYFQVNELMTNEDVFLKLKEFGFIYRDGGWHKTLRASANGHTVRTPRPVKEVGAQEITISQVPCTNRLEMTVGEDNMDELLPIIQSMQTLGFAVEIKVIGTK